MFSAIDWMDVGGRELSAFNSCRRKAIHNLIGSLKLQVSYKYC